MFYLITNKKKHKHQFES